jgi:hypothetical protein
MMSGYGQGQAGVQQSAQLGAGLQSDAIAAQLAASGNRYGAIAGGLGNLAGAFGNYYRNWQNQGAYPYSPDPYTYGMNVSDLYSNSASALGGG